MREFVRRTLLLCFVLPACGGDPAGEEDGGGDGTPSAQEGEGDSDWQRRIMAYGVSSSELSIMLDAAGAPHVAYNGTADNQAQIRHAWMEGDAFEFEAVDGSGRGLRKAWVSGSSEPRLVYDAPYVTSVVFYATQGSSRWTPQLMEFQDEASGATGLWTAERMVLARQQGLRGVEATGYDSLDVVRQGIVFNDRPLPEASTVLGLGPMPPMLALGMDGAGKVHLAYAAPSGEVGNGRVPNRLDQPFQIRYVTYQGGAFSEPQTISETNANYSGLTLAIDDADNVYVSYARVDAEDRPANQLSDAFGVSLLELPAGTSTWQRSQLPNTRGVRLSRGSMAVTPEGDAHIVYCTPGAQRRCESVTYAYSSGGSWTTEEVQRGCSGVGENAALTLDTDGSVHLAYEGCVRTPRASDSSATPSGEGDATESGNDLPAPVASRTLVYAWREAP